MRASKPFFLLLFLSSFCFTSCVQTPPKSYVGLNGNWHIAGQQGISPDLVAQSPLLTFALVVNGDVINASGYFGFNCSEGNGSSISIMSLTGQIAPNGTFLLTDTTSLDGGQITIHGRAPVDGATTWAGSYAITGETGFFSGCSFNGSSDFVADAYSPLNGTYTGTITGLGHGPTITVTTQVTQGALTSTTLGPSLPATYFAPLTGTISVSGSSSFTSGTTIVGPVQSLSNSLRGNTFVLTYLMNDGSKLTLEGWLTDSTESTLQIQNTAFSGPAYRGTLTRQ